MRTRFSIVLLVAVLASQAQTLTLGDAMYGDGDVFRLATSSSTIDPGPQGYGQYWNFTSIAVSAFRYKDSVVAVNQNIGFQQANRRKIRNGKEEYYYCNGAGQTLVYSELNDTITYTSPRIIIPVSMSYPSSYQMSWNGYLRSGSSNIYVNGSTSFTLDATGVLDSPGGHFDNVLRVTIQSGWTVSAPEYYSETVTEYRWYQNGIHTPLLSYITGTMNPQKKAYHKIEFYYADEHLLAVPVYDAQINDMFPNPGDKALRVAAADGTRLVICNSLGEELQVPVSCSGPYLQFDISQLCEGVYFVQTVSDKNTRPRKFVVVH